MQITNLRLPALSGLIVSFMVIGWAACSSNTVVPSDAAVADTGAGDSAVVADSGGGDSGAPVDAAPPVDLGPVQDCISMTAIQIVFSPMYSAFDGTHRFQIPAIVNGLDQSIIQWTSSNPAIATTAPDTVSGGTMITVHGSGTATITAHAGNLCGTSLLTVDPATADDWTAGDMRYNNGIHFVRPGGPPGRDAGVPDGSSTTDPACTNCHGPTAAGIFIDIAHTPEQIGGFSDTVLENVIRQGVVPDGGYFDPAIVSYAQWHSFHQWTMTDAELHGVIVYLRSLTPTPQTGSANFGGRGDGGMFGGDGGMRRDGGGRPDVATD